MPVLCVDGLPAGPQPYRERKNPRGLEPNQLQQNEEPSDERAGYQRAAMNGR